MTLHDPYHSPCQRLCHPRPGTQEERSSAAHVSSFPNILGSLKGCLKLDFKLQWIRMAYLRPGPKRNGLLDICLRAVHGEDLIAFSVLLYSVNLLNTCLIFSRWTQPAANMSSEYY